MKRLQIIIAILGIALLSTQNSYAQTDNLTEDKVYKTTMNEVPQKVKESLKDYAGYKISQKATFTKSSKGTIYKFKVTRGKWSDYLLINENGKIEGVETGEPSGS